MKVLEKNYLERAIFVHYGDEMYDADKVEEISFFRNHLNKPKRGGIWLSPKGSKYGWKDWAKDSNYPRFQDKYRWEVSLKSDARIVACVDFTDFMLLPTSKLFIDGQFACDYFDLRKLQESGFHGIYVGMDIIIKTAKYQIGPTSPTFKFWDCETLLLFNSEKIKRVTNYEKGC